jgi:hypothetical protein
LETISLPFASFVFQTLGLPGLIFIIWWWDHKAQTKQREEDQAQHAREREEYAKEREAHGKEIAATLAQYREDVSSIKQLYKNNVELVNNYEKSQQRLEKLYQETLGVISLNTQTATNLVASINNNNYCPSQRPQR